MKKTIITFSLLLNSFVLIFLPLVLSTYASTLTGNESPIVCLTFSTLLLGITCIYYIGITKEKFIIFMTSSIILILLTATSLPIMYIFIFNKIAVIATLIIFSLSLGMVSSYKLFFLAKNWNSSSKKGFIVSLIGILLGILLYLTTILQMIHSYPLLAICILLLAVETLFFSFFSTYNKILRFFNRVVGITVFSLATIWSINYSNIIKAIKLVLYDIHSL